MYEILRNIVQDVFVFILISRSRAEEFTNILEHKKKTLALLPCLNLAPRNLIKLKKVLSTIEKKQKDVILNK